MEGGSTTTITVYSKGNYKYSGTLCNNDQDFSVVVHDFKLGTEVQFSINSFTSSGECTIYFNQP